MARQNKSRNRKPNVKREEPRKDNKMKRINYDNARVSRVERDIEKDKQSESANDIAWYSRNPELLKASCSIPFAAIQGRQYNGFSVPGIMALSYSPAIGGGGLPLAANQCFDSVYSYVVHANSRNTSYTAPDLMLTTIAGMNVFAIISSMIRAYGTLRYYREETKYLPDALLTAQGFDPVNLRENQAQAWFDLNNLIQQTKQIWVPNEFPVLERWFWMNAKIFADSASDQASCYLYVQNSYWIFSETMYTTGTGLTTVGLNGKPSSSTNIFAPGAPQIDSVRDGVYTWAQWKHVAQSMINALIESEDRGVMYGDILKAYGSEKLYGLPPITPEYVVVPDYNQEVLMQIENTVCTLNRASDLVQIEEDVYPIWANETTSGLAGSMNKAFINMHIPGAISPENVMIATRNMSMGMRVTQTAIKGEATSGSYTPTLGQGGVQVACGTEIVNQFYLYHYGSTSDPNQLVVKSVFGFTGPGAASSNPNSVIMLLESLDWHPAVYSLANNISVNGSDSRYLLVSADFDNYTLVDVEMIEKIHSAALYSMFGIKV